MNNNFYKNILSGLVLLAGVALADSQAAPIEQELTMNTVLEAEQINDYLENFPQAAKEMLSREILAPEFVGVIPADLVSELIAMEAPGSIQDVMLKLLPVARQYALPPVSNFRVGAVSQGETGAL